MKHTNESEALERVSALADGQLQGEEFACAVGELGARDELRASWQVYHLVGEVLRSGAHAPCREPSAFLARFQQRLAEEPVNLRAPVVVAPPVVARVAEAANEPVFRWKMVAGVATVAAAAAIGWTWIGQGPVPAPGPQLVQQAPGSPLAVGGNAGTSLLAATGQGAAGAVPAAAVSQTRVAVGNGATAVMLRDPRLDELLEAHQQAGGASQMPSGFLRNATFEGGGR